LEKANQYLSIGHYSPQTIRNYLAELRFIFVYYPDVDPVDFTEFEPKKPILDSIRKEMIKQQKQNKITFDSLKVGDKVRIPFSTEYNSDGTHRTTLIAYSIFAYKSKYDCIIEAVITDKNHNNNGYNLVCKITSDNLCKPESIYNGKTMKIGDVFVHNMKYFKVLTE